MMGEQGPAEAWYEAINAISRMINVQPLPKEVLVAENDDWKLTINLTSDAIKVEQSELRRFEILAEGKKYLCFCILGPGGGIVGGMPEDQFIAEMKALSA